jgi:hypothetical protein
VRHITLATMVPSVDANGRLPFSLLHNKDIVFEQLACIGNAERRRASQLDLSVAKNLGMLTAADPGSQPEEGLLVP